MDAEAFTYFHAVVALAFVTGLIFLFAAVVRKTGLDKRLAGGKNVVKKLVVMETLYLDPKTRLVLVRFENREHLLLLGVSGNVLIESRANGENP